MKAMRRSLVNLGETMWQIGLLSSLTAFFTAIALCKSGLDAFLAVLMLIRIRPPVLDSHRFYWLLQLQFVGLAACYSYSRQAVVHYGNFCLTMLVIGTFGGAAAVYLKDSTPD